MSMIFIAVAVIIVVAAVVFEGKRRQSLGRVAHDLGFSYTAGQHRLPLSLDQAGFYLFTQGHPQISNRMDGERGGCLVSLFGFDYHAAKGEEGSRGFILADVGQVENRMQTVVWLQRPEHVLPDFDLSPTRHVIRRIAGTNGMHLIGFDGQIDFSDRYLLYGRDEAAVRRVFTPQVLTAFAADPGWFVEGRGDQWLVYRLSYRVAPAEVSAYLDRAIALIDRLAAGARPVASH